MAVSRKVAPGAHARNNKANSRAEMEVLLGGILPEAEGSRSTQVEGSTQAVVHLIRTLQRLALERKQ